MEARIVLVVIGVLLIIATPAFLDARKKYNHSAKTRHIHAVERAKMQLRLPFDSVVGAVGAGTNTVISRGAGYSNLLAVLAIDADDMPKALMVGFERIDLGDMNGIQASYPTME